MEERERLARQAGEACLEALKLRASGNRKIAEGHKLIGHAVEIGRLTTEQVASKHFEGHKLIAQGHETLAQADEMFAKVESIQTTLRVGLVEGFALSMVELTRSIRELVASLHAGKAS